MMIPTNTQLSVSPLEVTVRAAPGVAGAVEEPGASSAVSKPAPASHESFSEAGKPDKEEERKSKDNEKPLAITSRQLLEVQGNPAATAENAARIQRELTPPKNPYPSVQELATVRKAQSVERAARDELGKARGPAIDTRA